MKKYTKEDLALLFIFKEKKINRNSPCAFVVWNSELFKILGHDKEKVERALSIAQSDGLIEGNQRFIVPTILGEKLIYWNIAQIKDIKMDIKEKKILRYKVLNKLYEETNGSKRALVNAFDLANELNIEEALMREIVDYLSSEGLVDRVTLAGYIAISHAGVLEIEEANSEPSSQTTHFLPVNLINNTINIGGANSGNIQIGTTNSSQTVISESEKIEEIRKWIASLEEVLRENNIKSDGIEEEIETIKSILTTKKPKMTFIMQSLDILKNLMLGVASNAMFQGLIATFPK